MDNSEHKFKIAHIDVNFASGSTGALVRSIHESMLIRGHQSHAFYGRGPLIKSEHVTKISSILGSLIDVFFTRVTGYNGVHSARATKKLIAEIEQFQPDVVHLHELHGYYVNYYDFVNYLSQKNIPIVWTLHCEYFYTGKCGYSIDCNKWEMECSACPQVYSYPKSWLFDRSNFQFHNKKNLLTSLKNVHFVTVSQWLLERYKRSFLKSMPVMVVYNGINTSTFSPRIADERKILDGAKGKFICLSVAPNIMSDRKGGKWIIELARKVHSLPVFFIMIGVDNVGTECPENVLQLGPINDPIELSKYYSMADLLVLTSERETFSLVCVESLSCGTPVIGFASGGPLEVAREPFGQFVPYGDVDSLARLLNMAMTQPSNLPSSNECRDYAKSRFDEERMVEQYLELYRAAVDESSAS